ncbi:MAG: phosphoribosylformylglycinamidine cyclo-ligase [Spirochaetaceae bacterium]|jgi:phosphoribosylformylglycinamidine cyclo-ligase|nr:phosphoribosylformylglycinamidine cyclo-ligase [Spirochaetaceae bacterium]
MVDYRQSGVNIEEGYRAVDAYRAHAERTRIPGLLSSLGSFSGLFEVPPGMKNPVMVSGTDGVGTKLDIAFRLKKYDTVGIDCVAMSVNDVLCAGARPLFFLDYIACGKLDSAVAAGLVKGVAEGCVQAGCALLGGETAEMPGFYGDGVYDIAGFAVGIAEKEDIITGSAVAEGDVLVGLGSSGVHSNGFSLVRALVKDLSAPFNGRTIGEELLTPTAIYVKPVLEALGRFPGAVHGMAHITGGGFYENVPRMFARVNKDRAGQKPLRARIIRGSWPALPVFEELLRLGADRETAFNTFNMGIGFVLALDAGRAKEIAAALSASGCAAYLIGHVEAASDSAPLVLA